jgi:rhodanese-related sulfurtransferase
VTALQPLESDEPTWREVTTEQLVHRYSAVVLVDALGPPYFQAVHLPGAINIPPHRVADLAPVDLPDKSAEIVVYGNGSSSNATIVLQKLAQLGYRRLAHYVDGTEGWIEAGLPVE